MSTRVEPTADKGAPIDIEQIAQCLAERDAARAEVTRLVEELAKARAGVKDLEQRLRTREHEIAKLSRRVGFYAR